ncbi:MAG: alkaline phosphatase family protein [Proteobacteria bacterium]|nr:alkaline phosphatase family protein [Pseudomonadota bacterium]
MAGLPQRYDTVVLLLADSFGMTADHGQAAVDPKTTLYLNLFPEFSGLDRYLKTERRGKQIVPGGGCRDAFLYVEEKSLEEAVDFLRERLCGKAEVYATQDLVRQVLFGPQPLSQTFLSRLGNLTILPLENESVWWFEKGKFEQRYYGQHGGLSPMEMEIPFLAYSYA